MLSVLRIQKSVCLKHANGWIYPDILTYILMLFPDYFVDDDDDGKRMN